jgi:hypothetical protein
MLLTGRVLRKQAFSKSKLFVGILVSQSCLDALTATLATQQTQATSSSRSDDAIPSFSSPTAIASSDIMNSCNNTASIETTATTMNGNSLSNDSVASFPPLDRDRPLYRYHVLSVLFRGLHRADALPDTIARHFVAGDVIRIVGLGEKIKREVKTEVREEVEGGGKENRERQEECDESATDRLVFHPTVNHIEIEYVLLLLLLLLLLFVCLFVCLFVVCLFVCCCCIIVIVVGFI